MEQRIIAAGLYERRNAAFVLEPPFPTKHMSIEISNVCNHKCVFCPHHKMTREKRFIDQSLLYRILQEAYDLGVREVGLFIIGEPFTNPSLSKYIAKAKDIGYEYVYITTNGALATPARLQSVFESGLDSIKFSINAGSKETYREIHGADNYETVIMNAVWCYQYRRQTKGSFKILCSYVVTAQSLPEADGFKKAYSYLFDDIAFYKVMNRGGIMPETSSMIPNVSGNNNTEVCPSPFNCVYVTCEGYLSPCALDANLDLRVGDLNNTSLKNAWYGVEMKRLRQKLLDSFDSMPPQCRACHEHESILANILDI